MNIWEISSDIDKYNSFELVDPSKTLGQILYSGYGSHILDQWKPVEVRLVDRGLPYGDFPPLSSALPVVSENTLNLIFNLIQDYVEFLPLKCDSGNFYIINVISIIDCLDHSLSTFKRFSSGRVMRVEKYVFRPNCIGQTPIFKIPEQVRNRQYVTDPFKEVVERNALSGLLFTKVGQG
jgi:hypothetical protein